MSVEEEQKTSARPQWDFDAGAVGLDLDLRCYRLVAIQKTAYRYARRCTVIFGTAVDQIVPVTIRFPPRTSPATMNEVVDEFFRDLLDQELREHIGEETRAIRALILAQAFSKTDLVRRSG